MNLKTCGALLVLAALPCDRAGAERDAGRGQGGSAREDRAACATDVQKFCANIERAKGAMRACLTAHETQLSDSCKAARAERAAARAKDKS